MVINRFFLTSNYLNKDIKTQAELLKVLNHERLSKNVLGSRALIIGLCLVFGDVVAL